MTLLSSPRNKLIAASVMLLALGGAATVSGLNAAAAARAVLGLVSVAGLAWWFLRARGGAAGPAEAPRLCVLSRVGLAGRTGLALVEVDGKTFLVVHGDGFAKVCRTTPKFKAALRSVS